MRPLTLLSLLLFALALTGCPEGGTCSTTEDCPPGQTCYHDLDDGPDDDDDSAGDDDDTVDDGPSGRCYRPSSVG